MPSCSELVKATCGRGQGGGGNRMVLNPLPFPSPAAITPEEPQETSCKNTSERILAYACRLTRRPLRSLNFGLSFIRAEKLLRFSGTSAKLVMELLQNQRCAWNSFPIWSLCILCQSHASAVLLNQLGDPTEADLGSTGL